MEIGSAGGSVLASWEFVRSLYMDGKSGNDVFDFEKLILVYPPNPDDTKAEIEALLKLQAELTSDPIRQHEIERQADTSDLSDIYAPLCIENADFGATKDLIDLVLETAERVGYFYKLVFNRPRPNEVDPRLRPFIAVPPHAAFPSNHSFQMFSVAEVITRMIPEHPGATELFIVAQRVAENREYAGLHYASDTQAGRDLARRFAPYLIKHCRNELRLALAEWH